MKTKKILLTVAAMALVAVVAVSVTFAYLTDNAKVENTFTIGKVDITLDEAIVDEYGKEVTGAGAGRRTSNEYKLIPNHTYKKDPTIHVDSNSEKCWIFAKLENGLGPAATITPVTGWTLIDSANNIYAFDTTRLCHLQNNKTPVISTIWGLFIYNKMYLQFAHVSEYFHL